jgi:hypothetical protein
MARQARKPQPEQNAAPITIRLKYRGENRKLGRLHGHEIPDVPGNATAIEQALRRVVGPVVLILSSEEDAGVLELELGDPPNVTQPSPESSVGEEVADAVLEHVDHEDEQLDVVEPPPRAPVKPRVDYGDRVISYEEEGIVVERGPKILPRRMPGRG